MLHRVSRSGTLCISAEERCLVLHNQYFLHLQLTKSVAYLWATLPASFNITLTPRSLKRSSKGTIEPFHCHVYILCSLCCTTSDRDILHQTQSPHHQHGPHPPDNSPSLPKANQTPPSAPPKSSRFDIFALLPKELRIQIWITTFLAPPTITVLRTTHPRNPFRSRFISASRPPALLSTTRESRLVALSHCYRRESPQIFATGNTRLFANPAVETLYFTGRASLSYFINNPFFRGDGVLRVQ